MHACLSHQARLAEERYLRTPEAQLERLAGRTAGAWPCPLQREIKISGTLAQRTSATAAAAAKVAARVARPGEGKLLGNSGAPVLLRLGTAAFAMLAEARLAFSTRTRPRTRTQTRIQTRTRTRTRTLTLTQTITLSRRHSHWRWIRRRRASKW